MQASPQLDRYLPQFHVRSAHETLIEANVASTYAALLRASFTDSAVVRTLLRIRNLGKPLPPRGDSQDLFAALKKGGFLRLYLEPENEVVFGIAGKFWLPQAERVTLNSPEEWQAFAQEGYAKAAWNISLHAVSAQQTRLCTQTRVCCFGATARRSFRMYWAVVGPFSGMTRTALLRQVKRLAESRLQGPAAHR